VQRFRIVIRKQRNRHRTVVVLLNRMARVPPGSWKNWWSAENRDISERAGETGDDRGQDQD
jgi:hypothetical protein